jgi:hypothetical protein
MSFEGFKKAIIAAEIAGASLAGAPQEGQSAEVVGKEGNKIEMA